MAMIFPQNEVELNVSDILCDVDIMKISNITGIGYSHIIQQLDPNDSRKSFIYGALQILWALDEISPDRGERLWQLFKRLRESAKPTGLELSADCESGQNCRKLVLVEILTGVTGAE